MLPTTENNFLTDI